MSTTVSVVRYGESDESGGIASRIGSDQSGDRKAAISATAPVSSSPPTKVSHAAARGLGTSRSGTATDRANSTAPSKRPQNGAQPTKCELSSPNAAGTTDRNRFVAVKTTSASIS